MVSIKGSSPLKNILWLQWIAAIGVFLLTFTGGLLIGWTSPYLAQLTAKDSPLPLNTDQASWVASLLNIGRLIGAITGGTGVEYIGSKRTLIILGFPLILAWICISLANSVVWLYIARILGGISIGMSFSSFPLFLGEISSPTIRGSVVSLGISGYAFGTTIGNTMGAYMSILVFSCISLVPNVTFIILLLWIPNSPHYLIRVGKIKEAEKSIARYNPNADPRTEVKVLTDFIRTSQSLTFRDRLRELNMPQNRRALLIVVIICFFMQSSGINTLLYYLEIILTDAKVTIIPPSSLVIISGFVAVVSGWISIFIADKFRRKVLMIFSSAGVTVSMLLLGTHFNLLENDFDPNALQWLPIFSVILFMIFVCNGLIAVPNMIISELFAANIKSVAATFASVWMGLIAFAASKSYQPLVDLVKEDWIFWIHAIITALSVIFAAIWMPETKGKSLKEIQDALTKK